MLYVILVAAILFSSEIKGRTRDSDSTSCSTINWICEDYSDDSTCSIETTVYRHGEEFMAACDTSCQCFNGHYNCTDLCKERETLRLDCENAYLISVPGQCCKEWICPGDKPVEETVFQNSPEKKPNEEDEYRLLNEDALCRNVTCGLYQYCVSKSRSCGQCFEICEINSKLYAPTKCFKRCQDYLVQDLIDERLHVCSSNEVVCPSGTCVNKYHQCDGLRDCEDGSDEAYENCRDCAANFKCSSGKCVNLFHVCDNEADCPDGSDEAKWACFELPCKSYEFRCDSGECLYKEWECDGYKDCADGSDEQYEKCRAPIIQDLQLNDKDHSEVKMVCKVAGYPSPRVTWKRENISISGAKETIQNGFVISTLSIPRDAFSYAQYQCEAKNPAGKNKTIRVVPFTGNHPNAVLENVIKGISKEVKTIRKNVELVKNVLLNNTSVEQ